MSKVTSLCRECRHPIRDMQQAVLVSEEVFCSDRCADAFMRPRLYTLSARSIYRRSRADEGARGVWLVLSHSAAAAKLEWAARVPDAGTWLIEKVEPRKESVARLF